MKRDGIVLKGFKLDKSGRVVRNRKIYSISMQLKMQRNGSKKVRVKRSTNEGVGFL